MADFPVVRRDPVSGREVVFAPLRGDRPHAHSVGAAALHDAEPCPFCPGNEAMLPDILWQRDEGGAWLSRATTNRYPIVSPPTGHHEVIIETPRHSLPAGGTTADNWNDVLFAYGARFQALSPHWRHLSLFRNAGTHAGGSLAHPHSQLIALAHTPARIAARRRRLREAFRKTGSCVLCDAVASGAESNARVVTRSGEYVAIVPEIAEVAFEVWIVPVVHSSRFLLADDGDRRSLACILDDVMRRLNTVLGDFDYNMLLMGAMPRPRPYLHWYLRVRPRPEAAGGFELSTGMAVNPSLPDRDAAMLRTAVEGAAGTHTAGT